MPDHTTALSIQKKININTFSSPPPQGHLLDVYDVNFVSYHLLYKKGICLIVYKDLLILPVKSQYIQLYLGRGMVGFHVIVFSLTQADICSISKVTTWIDMQFITHSFKIQSM